MLCAATILLILHACLIQAQGKEVTTYNLGNPMSHDFLNQRKGHSFWIDAENEETSLKTFATHDDVACPGLYAVYGRESHVIEVTQDGCVGSLGGHAFEIKDQMITFPNSDVILLISVDKKMLRVDDLDDEPAMSVLAPGAKAGYRPWDSETDAGYSMIRSGHTCKGDVEYITTVESETRCHDVVLSNGGMFFLFGKGSLQGRCYKVDTASKDCPEGFEEHDEQDFFAMVQPLPLELVSFAYTTMATKFRAYGLEERALQQEAKLQTLINRRRRLSSDAEIRLAEDNTEVGGRSEACRHSHQKSKCMKKFSDAANIFLNILGRDQMDACKKSSDKLQKTQPNCCGSESSWMCMGLCCWDGGVTSCCGANMGWTVDVVQNWCFADHGKYKYIAGEYVCPAHKHSCTVFLGKRGGVCADNFGVCMREILKVFWLMADVVLNVVELVMSFGTSALVREARVAIETATEAARKAATKGDARRVITKMWKESGVSYKDFKHAMKQDFKHISDEIGDSLIEEMVIIMAAGTSDYDTPEEIAWTVGEVVDPTGIVSLVNYVMNGQDWCVYPESMSESEQKQLMALTGEGEMRTDYTLHYGLHSCGSASPSSDECKALQGTTIDGYTLMKYDGAFQNRDAHSWSGYNRVYEGCFMDISFKPEAPATNYYYGLRPDGYGAGMMHYHAGECWGLMANTYGTSICKIQRTCKPDQYRGWYATDCQNHNVDPESKTSRVEEIGLVDWCKEICDNKDECTAFLIDQETSECYLVENEPCDLLHSRDLLFTWTKESIGCVENIYIEEEGGQCEPLGMLTKSECQSLDNKNVASDLKVQWQYEHNWAEYNPCGCFYADITDAGVGKLFFNTRTENCDAEYREDAGIVCKNPKNVCYDISPISVPYAGPYEEKGTHNKKPFFCREDGAYSIHYNEEEKLWLVCSSEGSHPCRWNATNGYEECMPEQRLGTLPDHGRLPQRGPIGMDIGGELQFAKCNKRNEATFDDYWATADGDLCPTALNVIRTREECATALRFLQWNPKGDWNVVRNPPFPYDDDVPETLYPAGCSSAGGPAIPTFETSGWGRGKGRLGLRQICKRHKYFKAAYANNRSLETGERDLIICPNYASRISIREECIESATILGLESYAHLPGYAIQQPTYYLNNYDPIFYTGCSYDLGESSIHFYPTNVPSNKIHHINLGEYVLPGRAYICRETPCNIYFGEVPGFGTPFETIQVDLTGFANNCESQCVKEDECACFRVRDSGTCELFWYWECFDVVAPEFDELAEIDESVSFGLCPHTGASAMIPVKRDTDCDCGILYVDKSDFNHINPIWENVETFWADCETFNGPHDVSCNETIACAYFTRHFGKAFDTDPDYVGDLDPLNGFVAFSKEFTGTSEDSRLNSPLDACYPSYAADAECSACRAKGEKIPTIDSKEQLYKDVRYDLYRMALGFFDNRLESMSASQCFWGHWNGWYTAEGHGDESDCYDTVDDAKKACRDSTTCSALAHQSNICEGKIRMAHGGPTFIYQKTWHDYDLGSYQRICATQYQYNPNGAALCTGPSSDFDNGQALPREFAWDSSVSGYRQCSVSDVELCKESCSKIPACNIISYNGKCCFLYESAKCPQSSNGAASQYTSYLKFPDVSVFQLISSGRNLYCAEDFSQEHNTDTGEICQQECLEKPGCNFASWWVPVPAEGYNHGACKHTHTCTKMWTHIEHPSGLDKEIRIWWKVRNDCKQFGCTCQGLSDYYGVNSGYTYGCAPNSAIDWWKNEKCDTKPVISTHPGCDVCREFDCTCQGMADYYGVVDGSGWGCATNPSIIWWGIHKCSNKAAGSDNPGCLNSASSGNSGLGSEASDSDTITTSDGGSSIEVTESGGFKITRSVEWKEEITIEPLSVMIFGKWAAPGTYITCILAVIGIISAFSYIYNYCKKISGTYTPIPDPEI